MDFLLQLLNFQVLQFQIFESLIFIILFFLLASLYGAFGEKRIMAFFIYFELAHLLCILLLLNFGLANFGFNLIETCVASLLIIGSSGAETGIALALFMRYQRLSGATTFIEERKVINKKQSQPWINSILFSHNI